jgi:hypothetical protein
VLGLTRAVAVGRGVLIESENSYYHRIAAGFVADASRETPAAIGIAALHLYRETALLLQPLLLPRHLPVIEATLAAIATSRLTLET